MVRFKLSSLKDKELTDSKVLKYFNTIFTSVYLGNAGFNSKIPFMQRTTSGCSANLTPSFRVRTEGNQNAQCL